MWQYELKNLGINWYKETITTIFSKDPMNSEDQYWIFMNKLKSGAPSKILKHGNHKNK